MVLDSFHLDFSLFMQSLACMGVTSSPSGQCCVGSTPLLPDFVHSRSLLSSQSSARTGLSSLAFGISRPDLTLIVLNMVGPGSFLMFHSFSRTGLAMPILDYMHVSFSVLLQNLVWMDLPLPMLDSLCPDSTLFLKSSPSFDLPILLRSLACSEPCFPSFGMSWVRLPTPVTDCVHSSLSPPLQSCTQLATSSLMLDFLHSGLLLSLRSSGRLESLPPVCRLG